MELNGRRGVRPLPPRLVETVVLDDLSARLDGWTVHEDTPRDPALGEKLRALGYAD